MHDRRPSAQRKAAAAAGYHTATDIELARGLLARDQAAFAEVFRRHADRAMTLAAQLLPDRSRAEEVTQEIFLRLWRMPERYDARRGPLRNFLLADMHGRAIDVLRSDGRRAAREQADGRRSTGRVDGADGVAIDLVRASEIQAAVVELPHDERQAIAMAYFDGLTYREVAKALNLPEGTVKSRIRSGLGRLRVTLDGVREHALS